MHECLSSHDVLILHKEEKYIYISTVYKVKKCRMNKENFEDATDGEIDESDGYSTAQGVLNITVL